MENNNLPQTTYPSEVMHPSDYERATPFAHEELRKSLEKVVLNRNPDKKGNPLENMLSDKSKSLKASVNALLEEIRLREEINSHQFNKIDKEIRRQHTVLMQLENLKDNYPHDLTKDLSEAKDKIKSNVLELEREKRKEQLECWRDLMFLKKYLMVSLKDYWELERKRGILEGHFRDD
jgi:predicted RNase H-like nuclease (RuvC/YqgF family)